MRCKDFEVRLQAVLDERERVESDAALAAHMYGCTRCRALAEAYDALFDGLAASGCAELETSLADRVLVELAERKSNRPHRRAVLAALATAAAVAIAVVPLLRWTRADAVTPRSLPAVAAVEVESGPQLEGAHRSSPSIAKQDHRTGELSDLHFVELPAAEYTDLALEAGRSVTALVRCLPRLNFDSIAELSAPQSPGPSMWMSGMTGNFEPWTNSMTEALQMILDTAPAKSDLPADAKAS